MSIGEKLTRIAENQQKVYDAGCAKGEENLPAGYMKVDPAWNSFYMLFNGRPSLAQNLQYSDTANITNFNGAFQGWTSLLGTFTIPSLDLRKATNIGSMFLYSDGIVEIGQMEIPNVTVTNYAFNGCTALQRISFVPGCIKVSIGFPSSSLLEGESVQSILDGLADLTGKETQTLTLHANVGETLTDAQKAAAAAKNWTIVY